MSSQTKKPSYVPDTTTTTRCIWVTLEPVEVLELKRISIDNDMDGATAFFTEVLIPRVRTAASQRGVAPEMFIEEKSHGHLSG